MQWYHERLLAAPDAGPARDYLRSRGYDGDVVRRFRLGWAPDDWDAMAKALRAARAGALGLGARLRQPARAGPGLLPGAGSSSRSAIPPGDRWRSAGGSCPPRSGQAAPERPEPKYKNSQESPIYSKRRTLYALNWAKQGIIAQGEVVVCEGYTDVIGCFQAGVPWAVATCGTALAEEHFSAAAQLRPSGSSWPTTPTAPGRARRPGSTSGSASTRSTWSWPTCPAGATPATWPAPTPRRWPRAVKEARPFLQFRVDRMLGGGDLTTAEGRARAAEAALTAVAEHPDDLVRDQYVMQLADRCRLDAARLRDRLDAPARAPTGPETRSGAAVGVRARHDEPPARGVPGGRRGRDVPRRPYAAPRHGAPTRAGARSAQVRGASARRRSGRVHAVLFADRCSGQAFVALLEHDSVHERWSRRRRGGERVAAGHRRRTPGR